MCSSLSRKAKSPTGRPETRRAVGAAPSSGTRYSTECGGSSFGSIHHRSRLVAQTYTAVEETWNGCPDGAYSPVDRHRRSSPAARSHPVTVCMVVPVCPGAGRYTRVGSSAGWGTPGVPPTRNSQGKASNRFCW
jgi:hypothetical protein